MGTQRQVQERLKKRDDDVTIDGLNSEISRLNDELTCASEAHQAILAENERMKEALRAAENAFSAAGNKEMVERIKSIGGGKPSKPAGFRLPSSRKVA